MSLAPPEEGGEREAAGRAPAGAESDASASEADEVWMRRALAQARRAGERGEVPVGAVLVSPDGAAAETHNRNREDDDPTAHAEVLALRQGGRRQGDWRLEGHTLYVTLEPCAMCAGAVVLARIERLVYGAPDPKAGMCGSLATLPHDERLNHHVEITGGVLAEEAGELLRDFFRARR